jgi:hypothetical protein
MIGEFAGQVARLSTDPGLLAALVDLGRCWGNFGLDIVDHWEANAHGVGLAQPTDHSTLIYIDNFDQPSGFYYVELEAPPEPGSEQMYKSVGIYESVSFEELKSLVAGHLAMDKPGF